MNKASFGANSKTVLILEDGFSLESVEDKIVALGYIFQKRTLRAAPLDWIEMQKDLKQLIASENLLAVLIFFSKETLFNTCSSEYAEIWRSLLMEMKSATSLIFVHEENFQGVFYDSSYEKRIPETQQLIRELLMYLKSAGLEYNYMIEKLQIISSLLQEYLNIMRQTTRSEKGEYMINNLNTFRLNLLEFARRINKYQNVEDDIKYQNLDDTLHYLKYTVPEIEDVFRQLETDFLEFAERLERATQLLQTMQTSGVELVPYKKKTEISLRVHHFLDELDRGVIFHLYVPNGRYQEDQLASFLRLFESYLQRVEKLQFFIDTRRTLHGQIYEFKSKNTIINSSEIEVAFSRFESFMSLCQNDQKKAEALLLRTGMNPSEASRLMTKYVKDYQRLLLDIEHERERKMLDLRQRLESEAFELTHDTSLAVPQSAQPTALLSLPNNLDPISFTISNSSVIINPGIQSYVEQAIYGDIHYATEDRELLHLFERYAERLESIRLRSDLEQLKDTSSSEAERKTAKQKIAGFLSKVAPAIGQSALTVLTAYLEKVLTGS